MIIPRSCARHSSHSSQLRAWHKILRSPVWLFSFLFAFCFAFPAPPVPGDILDQDRSGNEEPGCFCPLSLLLILMLMNPDAVRTLLCKK